MLQKICRILTSIFFIAGTFCQVEASCSAPAPIITNLNQESFFDRSNFQRLSGRIIRGMEPEHFERLCFDPNRRLTFLMGEDGFNVLKGKTGYEMLKAIGYTHEFIEQIVKKGNQFKIIVFSEEIEVKLATWENFFLLASEAYPEFAADLLRHSEALQLLSFEDFEAAAGFSFDQVKIIGEKDERFMTYERYLHSNRDLLATRAFLYFTLSLKELYSGDGYTYDDQGNRGLQEYLVLNKKLLELGAYSLIDIQIEI